MNLNEDYESLDSVMKNIKTIAEYNAKIKQKLSSEKNPKLKAQALREYAPMDELASVFSSLLGDEDLTNLYKENKDGDQ